MSRRASTPPSVRLLKLPTPSSQRRPRWQRCRPCNPLRRRCSCVRPSSPPCRYHASSTSPNALTHAPASVVSIRSPSGRKPVVRVCPRRRLCTSARQRWAISVHARGVPRLAEERHDLARALLPCPVEGRLAALGSKRHIGAPFEKALGDREVAVACRVMQCCIIVVVLLKTNERPTAE